MLTFIVLGAIIILALTYQWVIETCLEKQKLTVRQVRELEKDIYLRSVDVPPKPLRSKEEE